MLMRWLRAFMLASVSLSAGTAYASSLPQFTELVKQNSPAVVNISTKQSVSPQEMLPEALQSPENDALFDELLKRFLENGSGAGKSLDFDSKSRGSGFIYSSDGYIVTNYHVVESADEITVRLNDGRELPAQLIGSDERTDVAVLKVAAKGLPVLKMGVSDKLEVGEWVLAIGSPFGFDHSATAGIVSAKGRSLPNENYVPFIQTDVAINPGNSGGPLFNLAGEVVGINSQIYSRSGGFMGVSFAIPIDVAQGVIEQLKSTGAVSRGWLGVYVQEIDTKLAQSFQMAKPEGALVAEVMPDGPAAGVLNQGDVILSFDDKPVTNSAALPLLVGSTAIGKTVELAVLRAGKYKAVSLILTELPSPNARE
jgi:serine protease Do